MERKNDIMLLEFTVGNYRSFNKKCTLSLYAQSIGDDPKTNVIEKEGVKILKTAAIYGANSSGKSNLILALGTMGRCVLSSVKLNDDDELDYDPFLLSYVQGKPTFFEILFLLDSVCYRYGFEYNLNKIIGEWLFIREGKRKEKVLFIRDIDGIGVNETFFIEGIDNEKNTNDNRLFLSLCAQLGGEISKKVIDWFRRGYNVLSGLESDGYQGFSKFMFHKHKEGCEEALEFFHTLGLGFENLETLEEDAIVPKDLPLELRTFLSKQITGKKTISLQAIHHKYNKNGKIVGDEKFDVEEKESAGTKKLIDLAGPIFDTLKRGATLVVDELDAKMHPLISTHIIRLFNSNQFNPHGAQLIFSTHDTHLLSSKIFRRDQIWFTEKDQQEQTDLYSIMDIVLPDGTKPRNDSNYEKNYINGRYGAIPYIN